MCGSIATTAALFAFRERILSRCAFASSLRFELSVDETDVSPGYAERTPARVVTLRCEGDVPARIWTGVLVLPRE